MHQKYGEVIDVAQATAYFGSLATPHAIRSA